MYLAIQILNIHVGKIIYILKYHINIWDGNLLRRNDVTLISLINMNTKEKHDDSYLEEEDCLTKV